MTTYTLHIDEQTFAVEIGIIQGNEAQVTVNQIPYTVTIDSSGQVRPEAVTRIADPVPASVSPPAAAKTTSKPAPSKSTNGVKVTAPLPGKLLSLLVKAGDPVLAGQVVAVIEAMKMENDIQSPLDGTVKEVRAAAGADLATGDLIMVIG